VWLLSNRRDEPPSVLCRLLRFPVYIYRRDKWPLSLKATGKVAYAPMFFRLTEIYTQAGASFFPCSYMPFLPSHMRCVVIVTKTAWAIELGSPELREGT
jgi:hypothetical protein